MLQIYCNFDVFISKMFNISILILFCPKPGMLVLSFSQITEFHINGLFPKWLSLNSLNSMNRDKVQKWYGYYWHYPSGYSYILNDSNRKYIFFTTSGYVPVTTRH